MNCQQFDDRIQQQLDNRSKVKLDASLQQHARDCPLCAHSLVLYDSLSSAFPIERSDDPRHLPTDRPERKWSRIDVVWKTIGTVLAASIVLIILPSLSHTQPRHTTAFDRPTAETASTDAETGTKQLDPLWLDDLSVTHWLPPGVPVDLAYVTQIDLTRISQIDVSSWVPREPMNAVRMLPTTIESIEPIYRYTSDLPGIKSFSSGINYTLTILRQNIPNLSSSADSSGGDSLDLGLRRFLLARACC